MGPRSDRVEITVGFHDPAGVDANNQCSAVTKTFRTGRHSAPIVSLGGRRRPRARVFVAATTTRTDCPQAPGAGGRAE